MRGVVLPCKPATALHSLPLQHFNPDASRLPCYSAFHWSVLMCQSLATQTCLLWVFLNMAGTCQIANDKAILDLCMLSWFHHQWYLQVQQADTMHSKLWA